MRQKLRAAASVVVISFLGVSNVDAQQIRGEVLDLTNRNHVEGALVTLSDSGGTVVRRVLSGTEGQFALDHVPMGALMVEVEAFGYAASSARNIDFDGQPLFLEIGLEPAPVGMEGIRVSVTPQQPFLRENGYYHRLRVGHGDFLTEDDLARLTPAWTSEVLRRLPSVRVVGREPIIGRGGASLFGSGPRSCVPNIWIDGAAARLATGISGRHDVNAFDNVAPPPEHIAAIEVYPGGATIPARWGGTGAACGVIVIWTKH